MFTFPEPLVPAYVPPFGFSETAHACKFCSTTHTPCIVANDNSHGSAPSTERSKLSCWPTIVSDARSHRHVVPSRPLYSTEWPSGEVERETIARLCGGRASETCPEVESHCLIVPSAEAERTLSDPVQAMSHISSLWAVWNSHWRTVGQVQQERGTRTFFAIKCAHESETLV